MAISMCIRCSGHTFELSTFTPLSDSRKLAMVQCADCGVPVGALDLSLGSKIEAMTSQITAIDENLRRIVKALQDS